MNIIRLPILEDTAIPNIENIFKISTIVYLINQGKLCYWDATNLELKDLTGTSKQDRLSAGKNILLDNSRISLLNNLITDNLSINQVFTTIDLDFNNTNYLPLVTLSENNLVHGDVLLLKENNGYDYCKLTLSSNPKSEYSASLISSNNELSLVEVDQLSRGIYFNDNKYVGAILIGDFFRFKKEIGNEIQSTISILTKGNV